MNEHWLDKNGSEGFFDNYFYYRVDGDLFTIWHIDHYEKYLLSY